MVNSELLSGMCKLNYYRVNVVLVSLDPAGLLVDLSVIHVQAAVIGAAQNLPE